MASESIGLFLYYMTKHEEKYCPRCKAAFLCKSGDIANCQCSCVQLSDATKNFLSNTYYDCLCKNCLSELNQLTKTSEKLSFPTQKEMLIENLHYYKENGYWVFTEFYHILRGYCCNNGCRHCAYGFKESY